MSEINYAEKTKVPVEKSQYEIQRLLKQFNVNRMAFLYDENTILFELNGKSVNSSCITGMLISGSFNQHIGLTQGCISAGNPLKVTNCNQNVITELDRKPAFEVLKELVPSQIIEDPNELLRIVSVGLRSVGNKISSSNRDYLVNSKILDKETAAVQYLSEIKPQDSSTIGKINEGPVK